LERAFGGKWLIAVRLHPHLMTISDKLIFENQRIIDVTHFDDIQELLYVSDVLITDYSSLMFDYILTGRPCFLYVPDYEDFLKDDRGLYFSMEDLPFSVSYNNLELEKSIINFSRSDYSHKISSFQERIGTFECGKSSERIFNYILSQIF
jgi:CDP-glycerol glycerophosphotransferase